MRKTTIFFILLVWADSLYGQLQKDIHAVLDKKNFDLFEKYAGDLPAKSRSIRAYWKSLRDVTAGFREGVCYFIQSVPDKENADISTEYAFRVRFITAGMQLIYYELSEEKNKKVNEEWERYFVVLGQYRNDSMMNRLKNSFKGVFGVNPDESELFQEEFVYGSYCGFAGTEPAGKTSVNELVSRNDRDGLMKWLQSANTEKQVYAVDGFWQLKKKGIPLTGKEITRIKHVLKKQGTIYVCNGCIHSFSELSSVTKEFKF